MKNRKLRIDVKALFAATLLLVVSACASQTVKMIQPQTGATADCSGSGVGIGASISEGFVGGCIRAHENRGFVRLEQLTPEQRVSLERRGLMPKDK